MTVQTSGFVVSTPGLNLARTLRCGQAFRWTWRDGVAEGVVGWCVWRLRSAAGRVQASVVAGAGSAQKLRRYLLGWGSLKPLEAVLAQDRVLARLLPRTRGISILSQDPWEVLATFLISQNNNIPKIVRSVAYLCAVLGEPVGSPPVAWAFPSPGRLAEAPEAVLWTAGVGYRAGYLRNAARRVADGQLDLERLRRLPTPEARGALLELPGVGDKVADCVLLFGLGHRAVFPVDVWVKRATEELYFQGCRKTPAAIRAWALNHFGDLAGLAQQHLYYYARRYLRVS